MKLACLAVPMNRNMLPLIWAFSGNALGLILILDEGRLSGKDTTECSFFTERAIKAKNNRIKTVSVIYTLFTEVGVNKKEEFRKYLNAETTAPIFLYNKAAP